MTIKDINQVEKSIVSVKFNWSAEYVGNLVAYDKLNHHYGKGWEYEIYIAPKVDDENLTYCVITYVFLFNGKRHFLNQIEISFDSIEKYISYAKEDFLKQINSIEIV
jgi:hypothetical protein